MEAAPARVGGHLPWHIRRWRQFEQRNLWNLARFRSRTDACLGTEYFPEQAMTFRLPCFWIRRKHLYVYGKAEGLPKELGFAEGDDPEGRVLFPIHPAELGRCAEYLRQVGAIDSQIDGILIWATPTSSVRTLLTWQDGREQQVFLTKLSTYSTTTGGGNLGHREVARSVGLSGLVSDCDSGLPEGFHCFPEVLGLVARGMPQNGVLFRTIPEGIAGKGIVLAPLFALMGGSAGYPPLLLQLVAMGRRVLVDEIIEELLLEKFARIWVELVFDRGLILEAHGQDLLLGLSADIRPLGSLYYRDFEGLAVDWALRRAKGLSEPEFLPRAFDWFRSYETLGYPLYQMVSIKVRTSIFDYLDLFLAELESALLQWRALGAVDGKELEPGRLTSLFSHCVREAVHDRFGMREGEEYDAHIQLSRFVRFLMKVRGEIVGKAIAQQG